MIAKDDNQLYRSRGVNWPNIKQQAGTIFRQRFFFTGILHVLHVPLVASVWSFTFLRKRHTDLGEIVLRIVVNTQKLPFSSFLQRGKDSLHTWEALKERPAWKGGFAQTTAVESYPHLCCPWSGLHSQTSSCLMGSLSLKLPASPLTTRGMGGLLFPKGQSQNCVPMVLLALAWITCSGQEDVVLIGQAHLWT